MGVRGLADGADGAGEADGADGAGEADGADGVGGAKRADADAAGAGTEARRPSPDLRALALGLSAWAGALAALGLPGWCWPALAAVLALRLLVRRRGAPWATLAACLLAGVGVAGITEARVHAHRSSVVGRLADDGAVVTITARVTSDPVLRRGRFGSYTLTHVTVTDVVGRGRRATTRVAVLVIGDEAWRTVQLGARVRATGRLGRSSGPDLAGVLSTRSPPHVLTRPGELLGGAARVRAGIRRAVAGAAPDARALVPALVVGDDRSMSPSVVADFRTCGLTHLAAVSGTNLTLVVGFLLILARWVGVRARGLVVVGAFGVAGFVLLARPEPSVLRAAAMGSVALLGLGSRGPDRGIRALGVALLVLLLLDPWLAASAGFALSSLATGGILLLGPPLRDALASWLPRWAAEALAGAFGPRPGGAPGAAAPRRPRVLAAALGSRGAGGAVGRAAGVHTGGRRHLRTGQPDRGGGEPGGRRRRRAGHRPGVGGRRADARRASARDGLRLGRRALRVLDHRGGRPPGPAAHRRAGLVDRRDVAGGAGRSLCAGSPRGTAPAATTGVGDVAERAARAGHGASAAESGVAAEGMGAGRLRRRAGRRPGAERRGRCRGRGGHRSRPHADQPVPRPARRPPAAGGGADPLPRRPRGRPSRRPRPFPGRRDRGHRDRGPGIRRGGGAPVGRGGRRAGAGPGLRRGSPGRCGDLAGDRAGRGERGRRPRRGGLGAEQRQPGPSRELPRDPDPDERRHGTGGAAASRPGHPGSGRRRAEGAAPRQPLPGRRPPHQPGRPSRGGLRRTRQRLRAPVDGHARPASPRRDDGRPHRPGRRRRGDGGRREARRPGPRGWAVSAVACARAAVRPAGPHR